MEEETGVRTGGVLHSSYSGEKIREKVKEKKGTECEQVFLIQMNRL